MDAQMSDFIAEEKKLLALQHRYITLHQLYTVLTYATGGILILLGVITVLLFLFGGFTFSVILITFPYAVITGPTFLFARWKRNTTKWRVANTADAVDNLRAQVL